MQAYSACGLELSPLFNDDDDSVNYLERVLGAADKYEMPAAIATMRLALFSPLRAVSPVRLYGIACRMSWEKEAKYASTRTLTLDLLAPATMSELVAVEPRHRESLVALHRRRKDMFLESLENNTLFSANLLTTKCRLGTCQSTIVHGAWFAFKYAVVKRVERCGVPPPGQGFGSTFYQLPEVQKLHQARCPGCSRELYNATVVLKNVEEIVKALPDSIEVSAVSVH